MPHGQAERKSADPTSDRPLKWPFEPARIIQQGAHTKTITDGITYGLPLCVYLAKHRSIGIQANKCCPILPGNTKYVYCEEAQNEQSNEKHPGTPALELFTQNFSPWSILYVNIEDGEQHSYSERLKILSVIAIIIWL